MNKILAFIQNHRRWLSPTDTYKTHDDWANHNQCLFTAHKVDLLSEQEYSPRTNQILIPNSNSNNKHNNNPHNTSINFRLLQNRNKSMYAVFLLPLSNFIPLHANERTMNIQQLFALTLYHSFCCYSISISWVFQFFFSFAPISLFAVFLSLTLLPFVLHFSFSHFMFCCTPFHCGSSMAWSVGNSHM